MTPGPENARAGAILLGVALCAAVAVVFWPLLRASFFLDDFVRLYDLANYGLVKLLISPHGGHLLVASNGVYALFRSLFGLEPSRWFAAVLALHALNTVLLFDLLRRLDCSRLVAVAMAALWGLCPVQAGSLGWMAVFGHVLLGTIMLLLVRDMVGVAIRGGPVRGGRVFLWWVLALLAATSFASGLGVAMVLPLAAALLLRRLPGRRLVVSALGSLVLVVPALYVAQHALYARLYDVAPFMTPVTAIRLEPRKLVGQLLQTEWFVLDFLVYGSGALLLGSLGGGPRQGAPWSGVHLPVQLAWLGIPVALLAGLGVWALWRAPRRRRSQALGLAVLGVAGYATLAVGGVLSGRLEALRLWGLSMSAAIVIQAMVARYHYVPTLFLAALLALAAEAAAARSTRARRSTDAVLLAVLAWLALRGPWDRALVTSLVATGSVRPAAIDRLESEIERSPLGALAYLPNGPIGGGFHALYGEAFPGRAALCVIYHPSGVVGGKTVRFVERDPKLLATLQAQTGTPISRLVVAPNSIPGSGS